MPVTLTCTVCGTEFKRPPSHVARVKEPTCSRVCNGKNRHRELRHHAHKGRAGWTETSQASYREKMSGPANPAWKGGVTFWKKKGNYPSIKYVQAPEWALAMARKDGYIMEHRLLVAERIGRLLARSEVVHHLDHDPLNNAPGNLELWPTNGSHKMGEVGRIAIGAACRLFLAV